MKKAGAMTIEEIVRTPEYASLIADYKAQCLWSAGDCTHPTNAAQLNYILKCIETYGNIAGFKRAGRIRQWL